MKSYSESEERKIREEIDEALANDKVESDELPYLSSSLSLFQSIKTSLKRCVSFSKGRAMVDLNKVRRPQIIEF